MECSTPPRSRKFQSNSSSPTDTALTSAASTPSPNLPRTLSNHAVILLNSNSVGRKVFFLVLWSF